MSADKTFEPLTPHGHQTYVPEPTEALTVSQVLERALTRSGNNLFDLSALSPILVIFLRHAGCSFCRETLEDIARSRRALERDGVRIVLVHMGDTPQLEDLLRKHGLFDLDRICDPERELYRAFGVKRGTIRQLFGPKVLWRALPGGVLARHGLGPARADAAQMPAMFLIEDSAVIRRYRHRSAADRPDYPAFCRGS